MLGNASNGGFTATFTTALAIEKFLPAGGTPSVFIASTVNPLSTSAGVFAGQLLAAKLNQAFTSTIVDLNMLIFSNCTKVPPIINGKSVAEIIYIADQVISGAAGPEYAAYTPSILNDALTLYNEGFLGCKNAANVPCFLCNTTLGSTNTFYYQHDEAIQTQQVTLALPGVFISIIILVAVIGICMIAFALYGWYNRRGRRQRSMRTL